MKYEDLRHEPERPCPITGRIASLVFTDHDRPGVYNACKHCHDDKRTLSERLRDLEAARDRQEDNRLRIEKAIEGMRLDGEEE